MFKKIKFQKTFELVKDIRSSNTSEQGRIRITFETFGIKGLEYIVHQVCFLFENNNNNQKQFEASTL